MLKTLSPASKPLSCIAFVCVLIPLSYSEGIALDRCPIPRITSVFNVTDTAAEISWYASDSALTVDLEWREHGTQDWMLIADVATPVVLDFLSPCKTYEVRLQAQCNGSSSSPSASVEFEADGCCRIPTGLRFINNSASQITIFWDAVSFAFAHHVRYRAIGSLEWTAAETENNVLTISELGACMTYEMQVGSQCDLDSTEFSPSLIFNTLDCGACTENAYCETRGDDGTSEWIDSVAFGMLRFKSGSNHGYLLQNSELTGIERKREYAFHVKPGTTFPDAEFYLRMWIDLDQDGTFTASSELLVDPAAPITAAGYTQMLTLSDTVALGFTRMRITLKSIIGSDTTRPAACGNFLFGEVEDYCISIEDVCPEIEPSLRSRTETSAVISWPPVTEAIVSIYQYRNVNDQEFSEPELTQDTIIEISGLTKCEAYILRTLNVCVQDTSSWLEYYFETECPNAVDEILPVAESLRVYPNPFSDRLTISMRPLISGTAYVRVMTLFGTEVRVVQTSLDQHMIQQIQLQELDALPHGMYLIVIQAGTRRQVLKVVK